MPKANERQIANLVKVFSSKHRHRSSGVLKCLVDADSHKWAQKMYYTYVSDTDFSKFPVFLQKLDKLLYKFGGKVADKPSEDEDEDLMTRRRDKKRDKKRDRDED